MGKEPRRRKMQNASRSIGTGDDRQPTTMQRGRGMSLLEMWDAIEPWQRDNEFIHGSYRRSSGGYRESYASLFYMHNQTVNVYTHLLAAVGFFMAAVITCFRVLSIGYGHEDLSILAIFFIGAVACFGFSAYFHLVGNHSYQVYNAWLTMDFFGIICLITGSAFPLAYYSFSCHPTVRRLCWLSVMALAIACGMLCFTPAFRRPGWRRHRAAVFTSFALAGFYPLYGSVQLYGLEQAKRQMGWSSFALGGIMYISGTIIYAIRFPERLHPGCYDLWGSSHQIFHVASLLGASCHLNGIMDGLKYHHDPLTEAARQCGT